MFDFFYNPGNPPGLLLAVLKVSFSLSLVGDFLGLAVGLAILDTAK